MIGRALPSVWLATALFFAGVNDLAAESAFWCFQPVRDPPVPQVDDRGWSLTNVDRFVFRRLSAEGLEPASPADRATLMRRVYFDLVGLPPSPDEIEAFLDNDSSTAYEELIDRLLASERYGERWAGHWLDLVRYADSDGFKKDRYRPEAYQYRDYVIHSFNIDKPYNLFVAEQLAGDEIAPGDVDALTATMFLRHGIYEYNQPDVERQWQDFLEDITEVTGDVFLAMGMECARCHDHKFDPIPQSDYYRLQAFFAAVVPRDDQPSAPLEELAHYHEQRPQWEEMTAELRREIDAIEQPILLAHTSGNRFNIFAPRLKTMIRKWPADRSPYEHQIAEMASRQFTVDPEKISKHLEGEQLERWQKLKEELAKFDQFKPEQPPTRRFVVSDVGLVAPPTTIPGNADETPIQPGFLSVLDPATASIDAVHPALNSTGRRSTLARWLTRPDHPLTARVIVNRIWQHHFGRGLVATSSNFGSLGERPSHPELLDYLATRFVEGGWRIKQMHRLIMTSAVYRQAALRATPDVARLKDPDNRWLWRMNIRRLDAEQIRDAMLAISGELDLTMGGASVESSAPRRTIYCKVLRNKRDPILDKFDAPDRSRSCGQRNVTTTATQALLLINGDWTLGRAKAMAARLGEKEFNNAEELVTYAWKLAFGNVGTPAQREPAARFFQSQPDPSTSDETLIDFCHVILNSNEFLYVD